MLSGNLNTLTMASWDTQRQILGQHGLEIFESRSIQHGAQR